MYNYQLQFLCESMLKCMENAGIQCVLPCLTTEISKIYTKAPDKFLSFNTLNRTRLTYQLAFNMVLEVNNYAC